MNLRTVTPPLSRAVAHRLPLRLGNKRWCAAKNSDSSEVDSSSRDSLYEVLGVAPGASAEAVKRAYKRLAKLHHPDVSKAPDAQERFTALRLAYEQLQAGGPVAQRPWWRGRWLSQLRSLKAFVSQKLAARKGECTDNREEDPQVEAELRRARVQEQLFGLKERDVRRGRRPGKQRPNE